jgi:hypothetical protein
MNPPYDSFLGNDQPASSGLAFGPHITVLWSAALIVLVAIPIAGNAANSQTGIHEKLLAGEEVNFGTCCRPIPERTVQASWIREAVIKHLRVNLYGANVKGELDLRNLTVDEQLSLTGCTFEDTAQFANSIFKQQLSLNNAIFQKGFDLDDSTIEHDAYFLNAKFSSGATFENSQFRGDFFGIGAVFEKDAVFSMAMFHELAIFEGATFEGKADFSSARAGPFATFRGAVFEREANFSSFQAGGGVSFSGAVFRSNCIFNSSHIASNLVFRADKPFKAASFLGDADFSGIEIGGEADFSKVLFAGDVLFTEGLIDLTALFEGATFRGSAGFNHVQFKRGALFRGAPEQGVRGVRFEKGADFTADRFGSNAEFEYAEFTGPVKFEQAEIAGRTIFIRAKFLPAASTSFRGSSFYKEVWFEGTDFRQGADFRDCHFGSEAGFEGATFADLADFSGSHFGGISRFGEGSDPLGTQEFEGATFQGVRFDDAVFDGDAQFESTAFIGPASFREATFRTVYFSQDGHIREHPKSQPSTRGTESEQFQNAIDLRGCTYQRIQARWRSLFHYPDNSLRLTPYDRQPYAQLEEALRRVGQDDAADAVYIDRREVERRLKWDSRRSPTWILSWGFDALYGLLANYGVTPYKLVLATILLLLLGTRVLSRPAAVLRKGGEIAGFQTKATKLSCWQAFLVSLHYFLPVDIPAGSEWSLADRPIEVAAGPRWLKAKFNIRPSTFATFFLRLPGWILVPLAVAYVTGLLRYLGR